MGNVNKQPNECFLPNQSTDQPKTWLGRKWGKWGGPEFEQTFPPLL